jgi:hypothetical protein
MQLYLVLSLVGLLLLGTAPSAHSEGSTAAAGCPWQADVVLQPVLTTSELLVGQHQLTFKLLLNNTAFVADADVVVRAYALDDQRQHRRTEVRAFYQALDMRAQGGRVSLYAYGIPPEYDEESLAEGMYVAQVLFDWPGPWVLEMFIAQDDGPVAVSRCTVTVLATPRTPALGAPAPQQTRVQE